jgi:hypothetical protein
MYRLLLPAALLTCSIAQAEPPVVRISQDSSRQVCFNGQCRIETSVIWGTGTIIGRDQKQQAVVLTCGHGWKAGKPVDIWFAPGDHRPGTIRALRTDATVDIGVMTFAHQGELAAYPLTDKAPSRGHALTAGGWGAGRLNLACVDCEGYFGKATLVVSSQFRQGDSGGPVVWDDKLVGVINGNMDQYGVATSSKACRALVVATIGAVPGPVEESDIPPPPGPPPAGNAAPTLAERPPELLTIMRRLDTIERRLDLLSSPFPTKVKP